MMTSLSRNRILFIIPLLLISSLAISKDARKYVPPSKKELKSGSIPIRLNMPIEVVNAVRDGRLEDAVREIRTAPPSYRSFYLLQEAQEIVDFEGGKRPDILDEHRFYQNLGVANHNLFLLLKRYNIVGKEYYKSAIKYYKKSSRTKSIFEKSEAKILRASLMAAYGKKGEAKSIFRTIPAAIFKNSFRGMIYLAAYHSAIGNKTRAIERLKQAYTLNPEQTKLWVQISDDFIDIENSPELKVLLSEKEKRKKDINLDLPEKIRPHFK